MVRLGKFIDAANVVKEISYDGSGIEIDREVGSNGRVVGNNFEVLSKGSSSDEKVGRVEGMDEEMRVYLENARREFLRKKKHKRLLLQGEGGGEEEGGGGKKIRMDK